MTHSQPSLCLADLRMRIESGAVQSPGRISILAFLDLACCAIGTETFHDPGVLASEASFAATFPQVPDDNLAAAFGDAGLYGRCRESLLRHARLAGAWPDTDPYTLLNQLARERRLPGVNRKLMEEMFPGTILRDVTRKLAIAADRDLRDKQRNAFRNSATTIDKLRDDPRVVVAGILRPEKIGPFPAYRDGDKHRIELPAALAAVRGRLPVGHALHARRAFELAVDFGLLSEDGPKPGWSLSLEDATRYHAAVGQQISANTAALYLRTLLSLLRCTEPAAVSEDVTADRVRRPERHDRLAEPRKRKTNRKPVMLPTAIEAEVAAFAKDRSTSRRHVKDLRRLLRDLLDAGFDIDSPTFLQDAVVFFETRVEERADLTRRDYRTALRTFLAHTHRLSSWEGMISRAKGTIASGTDMQGLLLVRKYAECSEPPIPPEKIDMDVAREFLLKAQGLRDVPKCLTGLAALDVLRSVFPELLPGPAIGDQRDWLRHHRGDMPTALENSLRSIAEAAGYGAFGVKELITAARRLFELTSDKKVFQAQIEFIPWRDLIAAAAASHPREMLHYRAPLQRLADRVGRAWTPGWQKLQSRIVEAGLPRARNPVDTLMDVAAHEAREPWQLDREWAWIHERSLRPDLRRKWVRAIENFDALWSVPEIAGDSLLPAEKLGPMPRIGTRLKNAHFPLPRRFETALEGETVQVLEAAHFVWRCLRKFGVHSCGDDPLTGELVSEENLERIMREQPFMTPASARLHVARIRDWRESRPGLV